MTKWIGRTAGDHRVVCYDIKKVYSCPGAAALDNGVRENEVIACCNRYIKSTFNNIQFDWYAQYKIENIDNLSIHPHKPKPIIEVEYVKSHRERLHGNGMTLQEHRGKIPRIHRLATEVLKDERYNNEEMFVSDFLNLLEAEAQRQGFSLNSKPHAFVKHLKTHEKIYKTILNMELGTRYHNKNRRHSHTIKVTFIPGITKEQIYVYDDEESYLRRGSGKAKLIVRLNDMRVYGSLLSAARIAKISRERILWCCLDDVTSIFSRGREVQFAFGRYKK